MSIQNITNLKELAERRVMEEEESLAAMVAVNFNKHLDSITLNFRKMVSDIQGKDHRYLRFADTIAYLDNPFMMDRDGSFLWPIFNEDITYEEESFSIAFVNNYAAAERYEFGTRNYSAALSYYQSALARASGKRDSAKSMNAIARLYHKMDNDEEATAVYYSLIKSYGFETDMYGLPYVHYALPQLLDLADTANIDIVSDAIYVTLTGIENGSIPLNLSSEILAENIATWMGTYSENQEIHNNHQQMIKLIKDRISFLLGCNNILKNFVFDDNKAYRPRISDDFFVIEATAAYGRKRIFS